MAPSIYTSETSAPYRTSIGLIMFKYYHYYDYVGPIVITMIIVPAVIIVRQLFIVSDNLKVIIIS